MDTLRDTKAFLSMCLVLSSFSLVLSGFMVVSGFWTNFQLVLEASQDTKVIFSACGEFMQLRIKTAKSRGRSESAQLSQGVENSACRPIGWVLFWLARVSDQLPRWYIICELEDDDFPAHPAELAAGLQMQRPNS